MKKTFIVNGKLHSQIIPFNKEWRFQIKVKKKNQIQVLNIRCNKNVKTFIEHVEIGEEIGLVLFLEKSSIQKNIYYAAFAVPNEIQI
ncbi:hypothetical protein [Persephonella sp.]|uniref:hypothetical protein n=1 Tax=Persephonella sp. TaxID=2060922 RepID=UPI0026067BDB|nr:hypothetical protein [Persephonella sp.]